jgi:hypothetical protein
LYGKFNAVQPIGRYRLLSSGFGPGVQHEPHGCASDDRDAAAEAERVHLPPNLRPRRDAPSRSTQPRTLAPRRIS